MRVSNTFGPASAARSKFTATTFIKDRTDADNQYYILLDEIQILDNFVGTLNGFLRHANFDTYVTGSNELVRRGFNVDVGTVEIIEKKDKGNSVRKQVEVDFVCSIALNKYYIQSAFSIAASEKMIQEKRSLKCIPDSFKKVIITKDRTKPWRTDEGILIISLKDFLLDIGSLDL